MPDRILVTGGTGFIGSHLCERLIALGHDVVALDNFSTSTPKEFPTIEGDVLSPPPLDPFDKIYHLACPASPKAYQEDPINTMRVCVEGTYQIIQLAHRWNARLLLASTSEIYGDPLVHPQVETYFGNVNTLGPRACYDEGKRAAEALLFDAKRTLNLEVRLARIFNTYGPRMADGDGRVVTNLLTQALASEPLTIYGDGTQTRSFCYVDDMVEGLIFLMNSSMTGPINLGNPEEFTINELAQTILEITGSSSSMAFHPLPQDDPKQRRPDITLAKALGWSPTISLRDGLQRMQRNAVKS